MKTEWLMLDVDGTLTDGSIYYDDCGNELKKFCVRDGFGFICAKEAGIKIAVITGRECYATTRRMEEMHVDLICQNVKDKAALIRHFAKERDVELDNIAFIGDDLNDYEAMQLVGFRSCPADAVPEIIGISDYVSVRNGGAGVLRDVVEHILREEGLYETIIKTITKSE